MYQIRNYGNDVICVSIEELAIKLASDYAGTSVAIHYRAPSGIKAVEFVDVLADGTILNSYGRGDVFDLNAISG
ncbi:MULTISPECIES: hypothetical protein [Vibrio]|uniref:hypothetical protein n=1 Tax=Vibrio TaxID=662 RepID=UPI0004DF98CF|nr:hypothetical protein [Vibrio parahaemolyticus]HAS6026876.1 hypothetical protein [Vibrio vulnificus]HAS6035813.1 hypothetical protein [Vibrio vulnificus]HDY7429227.1 hypothetical protein [Vibrio vulnificus]HDY7489001.1 hypothetical protein [Vibrio vulnificus]HDY7951740.1 hypothetical protein [Vibrio vulnificus]